MSMKTFLSFPMINPSEQASLRRTSLLRQLNPLIMLNIQTLLKSHYLTKIIEFIMKTGLRSVLAFTLIWFIQFSTKAQDGPFPPPAGQEGSTAISKDSSIFQSWASAIKTDRGLINFSNPDEMAEGSNYATFGNRANPLGTATGFPNNVISLGDGGEVIITFNEPIVNGPGFDFAIFENGFLDTFLELAFVEVSSDGENYFRFPAVSLNSEDNQIGPFEEVDATYIHNLAGKYRSGFGTPFDLEDLEGTSGIDLNNIRFVKIIDVIGSVDPAYASFDSEGNMVNDPFPTPFFSGGFDLEAIGIINGGKNYLVSNFQDLELADESFENGAGIAGSFSSGVFDFHNDYNAEWNSWSGWAFSNQTDSTTIGFSNQFSSFASGGVAGGGDTYDNFVIGTVGVDWMSGTNDPLPNTISLNSDEAMQVNGLYVTNTSYTALSMKNGDAFAKKFGGEEGDEPDWFKLVIWGTNEAGVSTDSVEFYLADYRFEDNSLDYIVSEWEWVELSHLGKVSELNFILLSSDVGEFGMNTPAFFCIDNITVEQEDLAPIVIAEMPDYVLHLTENPNVEVDLRNYFTDQDDEFDNFKFAVKSNSNEAISTIEIENGIMTIVGLEEGNSEVTILAQSNAFRLESIFSIEVEKPSSQVTFAEIGVSFYPNPFVDRIIIEGADGVDVNVYSQEGKLIFSKSKLSGNSEISLEKLSSGVFVLEIKKDGQFATGKILKQ